MMALLTSEMGSMSQVSYGFTDCLDLKNMGLVMPLVVNGRTNTYIQVYFIKINQRVNMLHDVL